MHVTLRQLRAFAAVVATGSFSEAARSLHLSQAALSGLIKELETQVGVRLLDRNTRAVAPSAVGEAFEPLVRRVLSDLDEALDSIRNLKELRGGVVRVAAPETLSCTLMPELISMYSSEHADVDVRFEDVQMEEVRAGLGNGNIDIGFGPAKSISGDGIDEHELWTDPLWVALRPDDPLAKEDAVSWRDIKHHVLFTYMRGFDANVLSHVPVRQRPATVTPVHRVNTALSMLKVKPGAVICPSMAGSLVHGVGLAFRPLRQPVVTRKISIFVRSKSASAPAVASLVQFSINFARTWAGLASDRSAQAR